VTESVKKNPRKGERATISDKKWVKEKGGGLSELGRRIEALNVKIGGRKKGVLTAAERGVGLREQRANGFGKKRKGHVKRVSQGVENTQRDHRGGGLSGREEGGTGGEAPVVGGVAKGRGRTVWGGNHQGTENPSFEGDNVRTGGPRARKNRRRKKQGTHGVRGRGNGKIKKKKNQKKGQNNQR